MAARLTGLPTARTSMPAAPAVSLPVRARLVVTVTVDPAVWDREYGTGTTPAAVRADLAVYLRTALRGIDIYPALNVEVTP
jgi:hypothetical protein